MSASYQLNLIDSQNYLKDPRLVARLIERCAIGPQDLVYEIGPGRGIITAQLIVRCKQVTAIEKDPALFAWLRQKFAGQPNLAIQYGDFLRCPLPRASYKVFSNIPFNLTSAIVTRLTEAANPPQDACLVMQKEAAEMFLGRPHESLRSVLLKPWFDLEILHSFRRYDFTPQPEVDCVLLRIRKRGPPFVSQANRQCFRDFVVYGFTTWRPTLGEIFKDAFSYRQMKDIRRDVHVDFKGTPARLTFEQWLGLFETFEAIANPRVRRLIQGSEKRLRRQQRTLDKIHRTRRKALP